MDNKTKGNKTKGILAQLGHEDAEPTMRVASVLALRRVMAGQGKKPSMLMPISYVTKDDLYATHAVMATRLQDAQTALAQAQQDVSKAEKALLQTARGYARQIGGTTADDLIKSTVQQPTMTTPNFDADSCAKALSVLDDCTDEAMILSAVDALTAECTKLNARIVDVFDTEVDGYWKGRFRMKRDTDKALNEAAIATAKAAAMAEAIKTISSSIAKVVMKGKRKSDHVPYDVFQEAVRQKTGSGFYEAYCIATETPNEYMRVWEQTGFVPKAAFDKIATMVVPPRKSMKTWTAAELDRLIELLNNGYSQSKAAHTMTRELGLGVSQSDVRTHVRNNRHRLTIQSSTPKVVAKKAVTPKVAKTTQGARWPSSSMDAFIKQLRTDEGAGPKEIQQRLKSENGIDVTINMVKGRMNTLNIWHVNPIKKRVAA